MPHDEYEDHGYIQRKSTDLFLQHRRHEIELDLDNDLTKNVIISEYIEIAEQMGGEAKFINKLLDKISKKKY